jgi:cyclophilin family peptidyl-prolyl cis-trans isomerase
MKENAMKKYVFAAATGLLVIGLAVQIIACGGQNPVPAQAPKSPPATAAAPASSPTPQQPKPKTYSAPPPMVIDPNKKYTATIETAKGNLVIELFAKDAPKTVNNFVFLAREGYYDNSTFHRVIPNFMVQGGDPTGTGMGGPGYTIPDEFSTRKHNAGALSMANTGRPNTGGSQFFITYVPTNFLDGKHAVFGQLIEGTDVLKKITPRDPDQRPNFLGDKLIKVTIKEG